PRSPKRWGGGGTTTPGGGGGNKRAKPRRRREVAPQGPGKTASPRAPPGAAAGMGVGAAPAESPPAPARTSLGMCGATRANRNHARGHTRSSRKETDERVRVAPADRGLAVPPVAHHQVQESDHGSSRGLRVARFARRLVDSSKTEVDPGA